MKKSNFPIKICRTDRKITIDELCEGISSERQLRRYLNGETSVQLEKLFLFSNRLSFNPEYVFKKIYSDENKPTKVMIRLVNLVSTNNLSEYLRLKDTIDRTEFLNSRDSILFQHAELLFDLTTKKISKDYALSKYKKLIDYPEILTYKLLSTVEFIILSEILFLVPQSEQTPILDKLCHEVNKNAELLVAGDTENLILWNIVKMIKFAGMNKEFNTVFKLCNEGLLIATAKHTLYCRDFLHYYLSLYYHHMNETENRNKAICACFSASGLVSDSNQKRFVSMMKNDFEIDIIEIIIKKISNDHILTLSS